MDFHEFVNEIRKPLMVWTFAHGMLRTVNGHAGRSDNGAGKRMNNAQDMIDVLVLKRAEAIKHEQHNGVMESGDF